MENRRGTFITAVVFSSVAVAGGCVSHSAPDFKGHWKPVNRFAEATETIPLEPPRVFYASPVDGTLKTMLARWAKDSERVLSYRHPDDFTLYARVAGIRTPDLEQALAAAATAYAAQEISIRLEGKAIVVETTRPKAVP